MAQKSVNLRHSVVLTGMLTFKATRQFVERYHSVVELRIEHSNNVCKFSK
jgi:hypothetical protein